MTKLSDVLIEGVVYTIHFKGIVSRTCENMLNVETYKNKGQQGAIRGY